jgi:hypothetical protein
MPDYSLGKIYKIIDNTNGNIYIGSTTEPTLARRLAGHVRDYKSYLNKKRHFVTSFKVLENEDYDIILIESVKCENKDELIARERYFIESMECVNKRVEGRTIKEYRDLHKEKNKEYAKEYRKDEENKKKIKEWYEKKYPSILCECGKSIVMKVKARHDKSIFHQNYIKEISK